MSDKRVLNIEKYKNKFSLLNDIDYELLNMVIKNNKTYLCLHHKICNNNIEIEQNKFFKRGDRCGYCRSKRISKTKTKDDEVFKNQIYDLVGEEYSLLSKYTGRHKDVKFKHNKCSHEGNQVPYSYDVKEVTTIDFDRHKVRKIYKELSKEMDDISNQIDEIKINTKVDYEFEFDINDKFEDILEQYCSK